MTTDNRESVDVEKGTIPAGPRGYGDATGGAQADNLGDPSNSGEMPGDMPGEQPVQGEHDPQATTEKRAAGHTSEANPN